MPHNKNLASVSSTEAQTHFGALIRRVYKDGEHIIVERDGLPVVVIMPIADYREFQCPERG